MLLQRGRLDPRVLIAFFPELRPPPSTSFAAYIESHRVSLDPGILKLAVEMDSVQSIGKNQAAFLNV